MVLIIGSGIIVVVACAFFWYEITNATSCLYRYIGKKIEHSPEVIVHKIFNKQYRFHLLYDHNSIVKAGLNETNRSITPSERQVWKLPEERKNDITDKVAGSTICNFTVISIHVIEKRKKYVVYNIEDQNKQLQVYIEDPSWEKSIAKHAGLG